MNDIASKDHKVAKLFLKRIQEEILSRFDIRTRVTNAKYGEFKLVVKGFPLNFQVALIHPCAESNSTEGWIMGIYFGSNQNRTGYFYRLPVHIENPSFNPLKGMERILVAVQRMKQAVSQFDAWDFKQKEVYDTLHGWSFGMMPIEAAE